MSQPQNDGELLSRLEEENKQFREALFGLVGWAERMRLYIPATRTEGRYLEEARAALTQKADKL